MRDTTFNPNCARRARMFQKTEVVLGRTRRGSERPLWVESGYSFGALIGNFQKRQWRAEHGQTLGPLDGPPWNTKLAEPGASRNQGLSSFQCPSDTTSTVPSATLMAVWSSIAYARCPIPAAHRSASAKVFSGRSG
jgi:hypothetical protein